MALSTLQAKKASVHRIYLMKQAILKGSINISSKPSKMVLPALELGLALSSRVLWMPISVSVVSR